MSDTLTTLNWQEDQRRYLDQHPALQALIAFLRATHARTMDAEGKQLTIRLLQVLIRGMGASYPAAGAPIAHVVIYGSLRVAAHQTLLGIIAADSPGADSPILSEDAQSALASLETDDPLVAAPSDQEGRIARLLLGLSWR